MRRGVLRAEEYRYASRDECFFDIHAKKKKREKEKTRKQSKREKNI